MMESQFQWVQARAECSAAKIFHLLKSQVTHDVELRNEMATGQGYKFGTHFERNTFVVFLDSMFHMENPYRLVRFFLEGEQISARYGNDAIIWTARLTLDDSGKCRLKIGDKLFELWQVSYMALEKLFFEIIKPA